MEKQKKILVIKNDKIGDMVFASGVFREIKKKLPSAIIDVVASPENIPIIEKNKNIRKIYTLRYSPRSIKDIYNYFLMSRKLRKEHYDFGIEMRGSFFNIFFLLFLSGVKRRAGFYNHSPSKLLLHQTVERNPAIHENFLMLDLINKGLGIKAKDYWPDIEVDKHDISNANLFIKKHNLKNYICIVPEASVPRRQWPLKSFDALIKSLNKKYPEYKVLLVGKNTDKLKWLMQNNPSCIPVIDMPLREVYLIFKKSRLSISPGCGPMHLAWASKTKFIAVIPKFEAENGKPLGENAISIEGYTNDPSIVDLDKITVKEVEEAVDKMLKR